MIARVSMLLSAAVVLTLGVLHLLYTFRGPKLRPRDPALLARMDEVAWDQPRDDDVAGMGRLQCEP
jgi:hypothetical protein